jgi:hypothetical protein
MRSFKLDHVTSPPSPAVNIFTMSSAEELSALDGGEPYGINNEKITRALQRFRALIERRANELLVKNAHEVVLAR